MKFASPLEELHHWLGMLAIDVRLEVPARHLEVTKRVCWLLIEKAEAETVSVDPGVFRQLQIRLLDLDRAIEASKPKQQAPRPRPRLRLVASGVSSGTGAKRSI